MHNFILCMVRIFMNQTLVSAETILFEFAMFQCFTEFLLFKGGNYMRKYGSLDAQLEIQILS